MMVGRTEARTKATPITGRNLAFGAAAMGVANAGKILLQLALLPIMARLLGPAEFGLYSLALPTVVLLIMLADGGLGNSLSREDPNAREVWSSAFWVVQASCLGLTVGVILWSHLVAAAAAQPELPPIMSVLSLSLVLMGFCIIPGARLLQQGRIAAQAGADFACNLVGALVGVGMAMSHFGAWSLVGQYLSTFVVRAILLNALAPFIPHFKKPNLKPLTPHLVVGGGAVGIRLVDFAGRLVENSIVSRFAGSGPLGAYSLSNQAPRMIVEGFGNPIWATLYVQALRHDDATASATHERLTRLSALIIFPVAFIAAAAAPNWVHLLLGKDWGVAGPMFMIFLPTYAINVVGGMGSAILYARGRTDVQLGLMAAWAGLRIAGVALFPFVGMMGVAWCVGAANVTYGLGSIFMPAKLIGSNPRRIVGLMIRPLIAAAVAGGMCLFMAPPVGGSIVMLLGSNIVAVVVYVAILLTVQPRQLMRDIHDAIALIRRR